MIDIVVLIVFIVVLIVFVLPFLLIYVYNKHEKQKQKLIIDIMKDVINDFKNAPYSDKIDIESSNIIFRYLFENGRIVTLKTSLIMVDCYYGVTKNYKIGNMQAFIFMNFFKNLAKKSRERKGGAKFNKQTADRTKYTEEQIKYQKNVLEAQRK